MERVRTLTALFEAAKRWEVFAVVDIVQRMWEKPVHFSTAAAMTCLMRANGGEIVLAARSFSIGFAVVPRSQRPTSRTERGLHDPLRGVKADIGACLRMVLMAGNLLP